MQTKGKLKGRFFCLTGKMWETRQVIEKAIQSHGGVVVKTVRSKAVILVDADAGRAGTGSAKRQAATRKGSPIISSTALRKIFVGISTIEVALKGEPPKPTPPADPIDREKHNQTVQKVWDDLEDFNL